MVFLCVCAYVSFLLFTFAISLRWLDCPNSNLYTTESSKPDSKMLIAFKLYTRACFHLTSNSKTIINVLKAKNKKKNLAHIFMALWFPTSFHRYVVEVCCRSNELNMLTLLLAREVTIFYREFSLWLPELKVLQHY